jgi:hypothetical protein
VHVCVCVWWWWWGGVGRVGAWVSQPTVAACSARTHTCTMARVYWLPPQRAQRYASCAQVAHHDRHLLQGQPIGTPHSGLVGCLGKQLCAHAPFLHLRPRDCIYEGDVFVIAAMVAHRGPKTMPTCDPHICLHGDYLARAHRETSLKPRSVVAKLWQSYVVRQISDAHEQCWSVDRGAGQGSLGPEVRAD